MQASSNDLAAARLSAQALLAQTYFSLRTADSQAALYARSVQAYQRSLELTQARYDGGVAARTDVLQAQTQLRTAQAQAADTQAQRAVLEHAIAVLLGEAPSSLGLASLAALPEVPAVPLLLPARLLERRPDIAAARSRVAAAYAQIGVTDAAFFPDLTLSASAGYRGSTLANLVSAPNLLWSLGPSLAVAVLDGGQRKLASAQARATAEQLTASYRQTVLTALQEVEDDLVLTRQLQEEVQLQSAALQAAQRNLEITQDQYRAGTLGYLNVVTAQTTALSSESNLLNVRNRQLAAVNQLLKNVAGRWDSGPQNPG
ncbi:efflux transporter outer membrane subunit [Roseateles sp. GG27B]